MMPSENTEKFDSAPPVNRSSMVIATPVSWKAVGKLMEGNARHRHVGTEAVQRKNSQGEEDLLAQLRNLECVND